MQKGQASMGETGQGENDILTDESAENLEKAPPVLTENPNPYFFPDDETIIKYEGMFDVAGVHFKDNDERFGERDVDVCEGACSPTVSLYILDNWSTKCNPPGEDKNAANIRL